MKTKLSAVLCLALFCLLSCVACRREQAGLNPPKGGTATALPGVATQPPQNVSKAVLSLDVRPAETGDEWECEVFADLTGVTMKLPGGGSQPAVLAAYVLGVDFDKERVRVLGVRGGSTPAFSGTPVSTNLEKANGEGRIKFTAVQLDPGAPVGKISVARVRVRSLTAAAPGSVRLFGDSMATPILKSKDGATSGPCSLEFSAPAPTRQPEGRRSP